MYPLLWRATVLIALNAIVIALVIFGLWKLYERTYQEAEIRCQSISLAVVTHLSSEISKIDLALRNVAGEVTPPPRKDELRAQTDQVFNALFARQKLALPQVEAWSVTDADGMLVFHEGTGTQPLVSVADREYFRDLKSQKVDKLVVSRPLKGRMTGNWVLMFARAIRDSGGRFTGIVAATLPIKNLNQILSGFEIGRRGVVNLRDADLRLIARFPEQQDGNRVEIGDARVSEALRSRVNSGQSEATYSAIAPFDQVERIFSFRKVDRLPMHVLAGISKDDFFEDWRNTASHISGIVILLLVACNLAVVLFYRQWRLARQSAVAQQDGNAQLQQSLQQLQDRDNALIAAQQAGLLGTYTLDIRSKRWQCSDQLNSIFGIDGNFPHTIEGWQLLMHPDDREKMIRYFESEVVGKHQFFDQEYRIIRPCDGRVVWVHGLGRLDFAPDGSSASMSGTIQDISIRRAANDRLHLTHEVFLNASEGIVVTDRNGTIIEVNPAYSRITGYSSDELKGQNPRILKSDAQDDGFFTTLWRVLLTTGHWDGEIVNRRKNGTTYVQRTRIFAIYDAQGEIARFAGVVADITKLKESQLRLERMAFYDELTGLPNRALFADRIHKAMAECRRHDTRLLGICCLDLDGFSDINERWGHGIGDRLLVEVGKRLSGCIRANDTICRLGGDEFVVLFSDLKDEYDARDAVSRLLAISETPYVLGEVSTLVTLSVGVSLYPLAGTDEPDVLLRQADQAMFDAKRKGKNCMSFFDVESEQLLREQQASYDRLVKALAEDEFRLVYQPKVDLRSGAVIGVEALLRWQHPDRGMLPPMEFLPLVEATQLTLPLGEWILHEALQQQRKWLAQGLSLTIGVNIFGLHLQRTDFVERLADILGAYPDVDPRTLELEVVETTALENIRDVTVQIQRCRELGVGFALDDFGTGYSSLTYLQQLPVDWVKIDRSFVRDMIDTPKDRSLVQSIVGMAHTLGRRVVAEGVETTEHGVFLIECGCDCAQGYGIARPMPPTDLPAWIRQWTVPADWVANAGS